MTGFQHHTSFGLKTIWKAGDLQPLLCGKETVLTPLLLIPSHGEIHLTIHRNLKITTTEESPTGHCDMKAYLNPPIPIQDNFCLP